MLDEITHESFDSLVGKTLDVQLGEVCFQADVAKVRLLQQNPGAVRQSFAVELHAYDASNHGQQMYLLSHPDLGDLNLFMVPIGPGDKGMRYEIVFN
jgi:hypothetical protein